MVGIPKIQRAAIAVCVAILTASASVLAQTQVRSGFNVFSAKQAVEIGRQSVA